MEVKWVIDRDEEIDPIDLGGSIEIVHKSERIYDDIVRLDDWFLSLIDGYNSLKEGKNLDRDLISEPDPLCFKIIERNKFKISYKDMEISLNDLEQMKKSIQKSITELIQLLESEAPSKKTKALNLMMKFID